MPLCGEKVDRMRIHGCLIDMLHFLELYFIYHQIANSGKYRASIFTEFASFTL